LYLELFINLDFRLKKLKGIPCVEYDLGASAAANKSSKSQETSIRAFVFHNPLRMYLELGPWSSIPGL